jgi:hypothetical protein
MKKNFMKNIPLEKVAELERLRANVAHAEAHGQHDTCHHTMLERLETELGLIPGKKELRDQDEVNNGEPNI